MESRGLDEHLDLVELDRLAALQCSVAELAEWMFHMSVCRDCRQRLVERHPEDGIGLLRFTFGPQGPMNAWRPPPAGPAEQAAWERTVREASRVVRRASEERQAAIEQSARVKGRAQAHRRMMVFNQEGYQSYGFVQALLSQSEGLWHSEPRQALELSELALEVWGKLDPADYGEGLLHGLGARVWAYVGNARRILSDLRGAEEAFREAWATCNQGAGLDPIEKAKLCDLESSLRENLGQFDEALMLIAFASDLYDILEDRQEQTRMEIRRGLTLGRSGRHTEAIEVLERLLSTFARWELGEKLYLMALQGLATWQVRAGRHEDAKQRIKEIRQLAESHRDRLNLARVEWLEGSIEEGLGRDDVAERKYSMVREIFIKEDISNDTALVSLDLAALHLKAGRGEEAKRLTGETLVLFESRKIHREALAAFILFHEAVRQEVATVAYAREIASYLRRGIYGVKPPALPER